MTRPDPYEDYGALQSFADEPDERDAHPENAEIVDPLPLQCFIDECEERETSAEGAAAPPLEELQSNTSEVERRIREWQTENRPLLDTLEVLKANRLVGEMIERLRANLREREMNRRGAS